MNCAQVSLPSKPNGKGKVHRWEVHGSTPCQGPLLLVTPLPLSLPTVAFNLYTVK